MQMKLLAIALIALTLTSCATTPRQDVPGGSQISAPPIDYRFAVKTATSTPVDAAAYNKMIAAQGFDYYCRTGKCDKVPALVSGYAPIYPPGLQTSGIVGSATVVFKINEHGNVVEQRVESATHSEFADAALRAIATWKFKPASLQGKPVSLSSRQQFPFDLR